MTMSSPLMLLPAPSNCDQTPPLADSPRNAGVEMVSSLRGRSGKISTTLALARSAATSASVSWAAKPLNTVL